MSLLSPLDFDFIVLDSQSLRAAGWPTLSADLESLFGFARLFKVPVLIPAAVELELQDFWQRNAEGRRTAVQRTLDKLKSHVQKEESLLEIERLELRESPDEVEVKKNEAAKVCADWAIGRIPLTSMGVAELFPAAASKIAPFKTDGTGFKDAVIFYSTLEYLEKLKLPKEARVLFITADSDFDHIRLTEEAKKRGVSFTIAKAVDQVGRLFDGALQEGIKRLREEDRQKARAFIESQLGNIEQFIKTNLTIPVSDLAPGAGLVELQDLGVAGVQEVRTSYLSGEKKEVPKITAELRVLVRVRVERTVYPPSEQGLRVGQKHSALAGMIASIGSTKTSTAEEEIEKVVVLEADASRDRDHYSNLQIVSVRLKSTGLLWGYSALQDALSKRRE